MKTIIIILICLLLPGSFFNIEQNTEPKMFKIKRTVIQLVEGEIDKDGNIYISEVHETYSSENEIILEEE